MEEARKKITVLIPADNEEKIIGRALRSVSWADEIFVVLDSRSSDRTEEIARSFGARVVRHEYVYSAKQKNWAIPQARNEWILVVDADEEITPELQREIKKLSASKEMDEHDGFAIARLENFLGQWIYWGGRYPLFNIRLFRRPCRYEDRNVHAHIILPHKRVKKIKGDILHYSNPTLDRFMSKLSRYSTHQANYMLKFSGRKKLELDFKKIFSHYIYLKSVIKDIWYFLPFMPGLRFLYMYVVRLGFLDGRRGLLLAGLYAFQDYVSKTKYLELKGKDPFIRRLIQKLIMRKIILPSGLGRIEGRRPENILRYEKGLSLSGNANV